MNIDRILRAAQIASKAHDKQYRKITNAPYVTHPLRVAELVSKVNLPDNIDRENAVVAAVLLDVLEDSEISRTELEDQFGPEVA